MVSRRTFIAGAGASMVLALFWAISTGQAQQLPSPAASISTPVLVQLVADGTDQSAKLQAAIDAQAGKGCIYIPQPYSTGDHTHSAFTFTSSIMFHDKTCLVGDSSWTTELDFINASGLVQDNTSSNVTEWTFRNLYLKGNADTSASATPTVGLLIGPGRQGILENVRIDDFAVCAKIVANTSDDSVRGNVHNFYCYQNYYPNTTNGAPLHGVWVQGGVGGGFQVQSWAFSQGEIRGQSQTKTTNYNGDGAQTWFDFDLGSGRYLWQSSGIHVALTTNGVNAYGQSIYTPQVLGTDFTLWDCGSSACAGSGGTQLRGSTQSSTLISGSTTIVVADSSLIHVNDRVMNTGANEQLHGRVTVASITDPTHIVVNNDPFTGISPVLGSGTVPLQFTQANVTSCSHGEPPTCGRLFEIRFTAAPIAGTNNVVVNYVDPFPVNEIYLESGDGTSQAVSDIVFRDMQIGGGETLFNDGGLGHSNTFIPTYHEIDNQCYKIGIGTGRDTITLGSDSAATTGARIGRCPGYSDISGVFPNLTYNGLNLGSTADSGPFTCTATLTTATPGDLAVVYSTQTCSGYKRGTTVNVNFQLVGTPTFTTASGAVRIILTGLPSGAVPSANSAGVALADINGYSSPANAISVFGSMGNTGVISIISARSTGLDTIWQASNLVSATAFTLKGSSTYQSTK